MSASRTASCRSAAKFRPSRFGATGWSCRLSVVRGTRRRRAAVRPPRRMSRATRPRPIRTPSSRSSAWMRGLPPGSRRAGPRAGSGPPARLEDRGDPPGEAGILARAAAGPAAQPGVEAARRDAHEPAQLPHREGRALGGDEAVPHVGTASRAKKAAARSRISFSCSSRLFSRFSRASSAASAFCRARASAEPAARRSLRHVLSWLAWTPSSAATCCRALPLPSSRSTASALYSAVKRRRLRSCAILRSRCWWNLPYEGVHPARAGSIEPDASLGDALQRLRAERIGALVVSGNGADLLGILSDRDILDAIADHGTNVLGESV